MLRSDSNQGRQMADEKLRTVGVVLFEGFELLDVYGPLEMWNGLANRFRIVTVGEKPGAVSPSRGRDAAAGGPQSVVAQVFASCEPLDVLFVPGGYGTRREVANPAMLAFLRERAQRAEFVASVCTGSALLAAAGVLDGRRATSNKANFAWVRSQGPKVDWVAQARWVVDGKFWTSSGVSAGIDMALALLAQIGGAELARTIARYAEYEWHEDPAWDPFAEVHGLV
jgi:transcriptional regulator GlxA family with amidase domain